MLRTRSLLLSAVFVLTMTACLTAEQASGETPPAHASPQQAEATTYQATGVVRGIDRQRLMITIHHDPVPGYMPEMTMPFHLQAADQIDGIDVGDAVAFTFQPASGGRHVIVSLTKRQ